MYKLIFTPKFFLAEGEPYDRPDLALNQAGAPVSLWSAIAVMDPDTWADLAHNVFDCRPEHLTVEDVFSLAESTNTCLNLDSPVRVCIDPAGDFVVDVHE